MTQQQTTSLTPAAEVTAFPDSPRVLYRKNPLQQVICQMRFPPILRIDAEPPAAFQDSIRNSYPLFREKTYSQSLELPPGVPPAVATLLRVAAQQQKAQSAYDFLSEDEVWTVGLTREFLSVTTTKYERWEDFRDHLSKPLEALCRAYEPLYFTRIGLRYQDIIQRSKLGLQQHTWAQLLRPHIAGVFCSKDLRGTVAELYTEVLISLGTHSGKVRIKHGLAQATDDNEECYLIDSDFFTDDKKGTSNAIDILNLFNRQAGKLFRWCIHDELDRAMEPVPVTD